MYLQQSRRLTFFVLIAVHVGLLVKKGHTLTLQGFLKGKFCQRLTYEIRISLLNAT